MAKKAGRRKPRGAGFKTTRFGLVLQFLREQRRKRTSLDAVVADLGSLGFQISRSAVYAYERGRVPDVVFLEGFSRLVRVPREALVDALMADLRGDLTRSPEEVGRDLLRHIQDVQAALHTNGGADVVLSATEARALADRNQDLEAYARALEDALQAIARTADELTVQLRAAGSLRSHA